MSGPPHRGSHAKTDIEPLIAQIRKRWSEIEAEDHRDEPFLLHLRTLGQWQQKRDEYPDETAEFPLTIPVAYAFCYPDCGTREFIVEGSTQECQHCGRLMFRTDTRDYKLIEQQADT